MLLSAGWVFGEAGVYPPVIGMWVPNVAMGAVGLYLLVRMANERPLKLDIIYWPVRKAGSFFARRKGSSPGEL